MKILHVGSSELNGGAARASYRIHRSLVNSGLDSKMILLFRESDDPTVTKAHGPVRRRLNAGIATLPLKYLGISVAWPKTGLGQKLNASDADLLHLHWLGFGTLSIEEIGRLNKPVVWTLHDMWSFCGGEHYCLGNRYVEGYKRSNRPNHENGPDLNRWIWERKRRSWRKPMQTVTPSHWLASCVRQSALMQHWPVSVIPNPLDLTVWYPVDRRIARNLCHLPQDVPLLLFGAIGGTRDPRKGADLLLAALEKLQGQLPSLELVVFGQSRPSVIPELGFPIHYMGQLHDDLSLRLLYSAADAMVIPSRQDNLPNTGLEALACGTPVVAFNIGGLPDIVCHQQTGWLSNAFDTSDLARGIQWVLEDGLRLARLGQQSRAYAEKHFAESDIAQCYQQLYDQLLSYPNAASGIKFHNI